ncbi:MAG: hypothetical protein AAF329_00400 [Cyanobacteria bacterium P01_A01_bin.17]
MSQVTLNISAEALIEYIRKQRQIAQEAATVSRHIQQTVPVYLERLKHLEEQATETADHLEGVIQAKQTEHDAKVAAEMVSQVIVPRTLPPLLPR